MLVEIFDTHAARLQKSMRELTTRDRVKSEMHAKAGHERSLDAMLRQITLMCAEAEKTLETEFSPKVIAIFNKTVLLKQLDFRFMRIGGFKCTTR